jgi:hypothetical protein
MGQDSLSTLFRTNFALMQHHKWGLNEIESMMPWERYVYIDLLEQHIKEEDAKQRDYEAQARTNQNVSRVNMQPAKNRVR